MKHKFWIGILIGGVMGLVLLSVVSATWAATTATTYDLSWNTIAGGGASFTTTGKYNLGATIGQPATGPLSGGIYALNAGFWLPGTYDIYLPLVMKNY
jgi:hypothetical protein